MKLINVSASFISFEGDFMLSTLHIEEITEKYLNTNLTCIIEHPAGSDSGTVILIPGDL